MKALSIRTYVISILLVIVILTSIIIYQNSVFTEEKKSILNSFKQIASYNLLNLNSGMSLTLYLLENNGTVDSIRLSVYTIIDNSHTLSPIYLKLYEYTDDTKFWKLHVVFDNIFIFTADVVTDMPADMIIKLRNNTETLNEIYSLLDNMMIKYNNDLYLASTEEIEHMLSLTERLVEYYKSLR